MNFWSDHLIVAPIVLPLAAAAFLLFFDDRRRALKSTVSLLSALGLLGINVLLLFHLYMDASAGEATTHAYLVGNWPPPFAIVLVLDPLSGFMLALAAALAVPALIFSLARWHRAGPHFHSLFLLLLMGLNGAFLTGDLFNLFVFFEVMLAASYGLVLHGSGQLRVRAGLHYIVVNLAASLLFLIGVALIYGVTGTLNMAHLAQRIAVTPLEDRLMLEAGAAILGIAFLVKAGMWPLSFWLPPAYSAAAAPVAAIFAVMSKVGLYVLLRLSLLFFSDEAGSSAGFGQDVLLYGGMATLTYGMIGVLASQALGRLASFSVLVSSGTLLIAIGIGNVGVTAGALFYLASSTLAISAFFLLIELIERGQDAIANVLAVTMEAYGEGEEEEEEEAGGMIMPGTLAVLGFGFATCGMLLAGMPPLPGFLAKFAMLSGVLNPDDVGEGGEMTPALWAFAVLLLLSGLSALIAMTRTGIRTFWTPVEQTVPRVLLIEVVPIALLLGLTLALTVQAGPVMRFLDTTAQGLHSPTGYIEGVMQAPRTEPWGSSRP